MAMDENTSIFLSAIRQVLPQFKLYDDMRLEKKIGKERLEDAVLSSMSLIDGEYTKQQKEALFCQFLKCLEKHIQIPFTLKTMIDNMSLLQCAIDECFPGYIQARFLRYTILPLSKGPTGCRL